MSDFKYIQDEDTFGLKYFEYGQAFYGSYKGMRFRIARDPMEAVWFLPEDKKAEGSLVAAVWPEPYGYDATPDELKTVSSFPFSDEGKLEMTGWLNEMYELKNNN